MIQKILILTTGGSSDPLVTSIKLHKPDYVYFLCSADRDKGQVGSYITVDGAGLPCKEKGKEDRPSIVAWSGLQRDQYEVLLIENIDSFADCYAGSVAALHRARQIFAHPEVLVDYTGGTKSMSAGLVAAAIDDGQAGIYVVSGERPDLDKVRHGSQRVVKARWKDVVYKRRLAMIDQRLSEYNYVACLEAITQLNSEVEAGSKQDSTLQIYAAICRAFLNWDRFQHQEAMEHLNPYAGYFVEEKKFLSRVNKARDAFLGDAPAGGTQLNFFLVHDLLRNAQRQMILQHYDEAVARTYRALELIAQLCLFYNQPFIRTGDVKIDLLPADLQPRYLRMQEQMQSSVVEEARQPRLQLPMFRAYILLEELGHPFGELFEEKQQPMLHLSRIRNNGILAHGLEPVRADDAQEFYQFTCDFLLEGERRLKIKNDYNTAPNFPQVMPAELLAF